MTIGIRWGLLGESNIHSRLLQPLAEKIGKTEPRKSCWRHPFVSMGAQPPLWL